MSGRTPIVAGNWKMNGLKASRSEIEAIVAELTKGPEARAEAMICPPATLIAEFAGLAAGSALKIGAQDCHARESGAHTGDISAAMLADAGASSIIVGHSERRADHHETDGLVRAKAAAVLGMGLRAIICVGETEGQRKAGETLSVVAGQLRGSLPDGANAQNCVIAYEPVWAIGTGLTPTVEDVAEVHAMIRRELEGLVGNEADNMAILYGGSVKPGNAGELMGVDNVDGALVGGASLKAADFLGILSVYR